MTTWADAHREAMVRAAHLHHDLGLDTTQRIPIFDAIDNMDVMLNVAPLPKLSGAYVRQDDAPPGIMVNLQHPLSRQRFSAAHELGHHVFGHGSTLDPEAGELLEVQSGGVPDEEKVAEAFAAWFLMPQSAVRAALARAGVTKPTRPVDAYRVAVDLGTSYTATVHHMTLMRLIDSQTDRAWRKVAPAKIKRELAGADTPENAWRDVHLVGLPVTDSVHAHPGDRLVIDVVENASTGYQWTVQPDGGGLAVAADRDLAVDLDGPPGSGSVRRFVIEVGNEPGSLELTLARPWESDIAAVRHETVDVAIDRTRRGIPERWFELA